MVNFVTERLNQFDDCIYSKLQDSSYLSIPFQNLEEKFGISDQIIVKGNKVIFKLPFVNS